MKDAFNTPYLNYLLQMCIFLKWGLFHFHFSQLRSCFYSWLRWRFKDQPCCIFTAAFTSLTSTRSPDRSVLSAMLTSGTATFSFSTDLFLVLTCILLWMNWMFSVVLVSPVHCHVSWSQAEGWTTEAECVELLHTFVFPKTVLQQGVSTMILKWYLLSLK